MKYIVTINEKQYEVEVEKGKAVAAYVGEAPAPAPAVAAAPAAAPAPAAAAPAPAPAAAPGSGTPVNSPMPGKIIDIKCSQGQAVKNGDLLFILEAMKMENEIFASADGTISSICVNQGETADTGAVLCTIA